MSVVQTLEKIRDQKALAEGEIFDFVRGVVDGTVPDYQLAAFTAHVYHKGLPPSSIAHLTRAMIETGEKLDLSAIDLPKVDKHSTGGVGDKISLPLAPLVACFDVAVPMISGRGLGITGGTLDKLEAIPGLNVRLDQEQIVKILGDCGFVMAGQTTTLAPADRKMYSLRDVCATVPSIPLITASILSKKLSEGIEGLVLDVKVGKAAFMGSHDRAQALARQMIEVAEQLGTRTSAFITDMNQPLGRCIGNALEIYETIQILKNQGPEDVHELTLDLGARMLVLGGLVASDKKARELLEEKLVSGEGLERFRRMVKLQGGDVRYVDEPDRLIASDISVHGICAERSGYIQSVNADAIGRAVWLLGAGRKTAEDSVDPRVGISNLAQHGQYIEPGDLLAQVHYADQAKFQEAMGLLSEAFEFSDQEPAPRTIIYEDVGAGTA